jgi:opacity protein-like surface antigen
MKRYFLSGLIIFLIFSGPISGKTGIAAGGGLLYPGFFKSERYGSQFRIGPGFDLTLRHRLFKITPSFIIDSRYSIRNYYCDVNLSDESARFHFAYLSIDLTVPFTTISQWQFYGGGGLSLANISGKRDYFNETVTGTALMPEILAGVEFLFGENFNLYFEMMLQYGSISIDVDKDVIPVHGVKLSLGGTMYLTAD